MSQSARPEDAKSCACHELDGCTFLHSFPDGRARPRVQSIQSWKKSPQEPRRLVSIASTGPPPHVQGAKGSPARRVGGMAPATLACALPRKCRHPRRGLPPRDGFDARQDPQADPAGRSLHRDGSGGQRVSRHRSAAARRSDLGSDRSRRRGASGACVSATSRAGSEFAKTDPGFAEGRAPAATGPHVVKLMRSSFKLGGSLSGHSVI